MPSQLPQNRSVDPKHCWQSIYKDLQQRSHLSSVGLSSLGPFQIRITCASLLVVPKIFQSRRGGGAFSFQAPLLCNHVVFWLWNADALCFETYVNYTYRNWNKEIEVNWFISFCCFNDFLFSTFLVSLVFSFCCSILYYCYLQIVL